MAERRMFAKTIIDSDAFVDMPLSTQALYFHLSMRADDDGFINNPKKIQRMIGASDDDLKVLCMKRFIIPFESGIVVIKHWKIHNYIRNDRYKPTVYTTEKALITSKENGAYTEVDTTGIPSDNQAVYQMDTQYRLGKVSLDKDSLVEGSVVDATATEEDKLNRIGGKLGKNVVYLSDKQFADLIDRLGMDAFNRYVERLADFIIDKNAHVHNHYETILKWFAEDSAVKKENNCQQIVDLFNSLCPSFPSVKHLSDPIIHDIEDSLTKYSLDDFELLFKKAEASYFLKGENDRRWAATIDWLVKPDNIAKVLNGNFDNKRKKSSGASFDLEAYERMIEKAANPPKTAAEDEGIRERAEALQKQLAGK